MPFVLPRSLWRLVLLALAGCAAWGFLAPEGLLVLIGLLSAFAPFAHMVQQMLELPEPLRLPRR